MMENLFLPEVSLNSIDGLYVNKYRSWNYRAAICKAYMRHKFPDIEFNFFRSLSSVSEYQKDLDTLLRSQTLNEVIIWETMSPDFALTYIDDSSTTLGRTAYQYLKQAKNAKEVKLTFMQKLPDVKNLIMSDGLLVASYLGDPVLYRATDFEMVFAFFQKHFHQIPLYLSTIIDYIPQLWDLSEEEQDIPF